MLLYLSSSHIALGTSFIVQLDDRSTKNGDRLVVKWKESTLDSHCCTLKINKGELEIKKLVELELQKAQYGGRKKQDFER